MAHVRRYKGEYHTITFEISDTDFCELQGRIILSGLQKKEYYTKSILDKRIEVYPGSYVVAKLRVTLEKIYNEVKNCKTEANGLLLEVLEQLLDFAKEKEAPDAANTRDN